MSEQLPTSLHTGETRQGNGLTIGVFETGAAIIATGASYLGPAMNLTDLPRQINMIDYAAHPDIGNYAMNAVQTILLATLAIGEFKRGDRNDDLVNPIHIVLATVTMLALPTLITEIGEIATNWRDPKNMIKAAILTYGMVSTIRSYLGTREPHQNARSKGNDPQPVLESSPRLSGDTTNNHALASSSEMPGYDRLHVAQKYQITPAALQIIEDFSNEKERQLLLHYATNINQRGTANGQAGLVGIYNNIMKRSKIESPQNPITEKVKTKTQKRQGVIFTSISRSTANILKNKKD